MHYQNTDNVKNKVTLVKFLFESSNFYPL